jgi:Subtilase family
VAACGRLCALIVLAIAALVPATAGAAVTPAVSAQATANVTDATTGISNASSSVVPRDACSAPSPGQATCLAQFLAQRGTRTPIRAHVRPAASPDRFTRRRGRTRGATSPLAMPAAAAPQPGTPAYLQQAYDLAYLSQNAGADQTVAVIDAYDDPTAESDLAAYRAKFSLPPCTTDNGCFQKVDKNGNPIVSGSGAAPATNNAWGLEISLDLDAVSALCPKCHILLVEANSFSPQVMAAAQQTAKNLGATVISDSWRILPTTSDQQRWFENSATFAFPGIATVAASGDTGYLGIGSDPACNGLPANSTLCNAYPAALPGVTAVGGTTLAPASGARGFGESGWSWKNAATRDPTSDGATGSGCDTTTMKPKWQTDTGCAGRSYNDISAAADPATGMLVYDPSYTFSDQSHPADGWIVVGGTSEAAPLVAAYYALLQSTTGQSASVSLETPEWLYDTPVAKQLNDPVGGLNGPCDPLAPYLCTAGTGYDGPTGMGSISGAVVNGAPGIDGPGPTGSYASGLSATGVHLQGGVYPNGNDTSYWWQYGTSTAYEHKTPAVDIGSGTAPAAVSDALTGLQPNTTYNYQLMAENSVGIEAGYDFTFTTPSAPAPTVTTTPPPPPTTITPPPAPTSPPPTTVPRTLPSAPSLGRLRILALGAGTATAGATIDTHGAPTTYYLAYGTTPALARRAPARASTSAGNATWNLRGLAAGRVYYLQVLAANAGGPRRTAVVRVKTSPVALGRAAVQAGKLAVVVRCHGSAACPVRLTAKGGNRVIAAGSARIRGNHSATVLLKLNRAAVAHARQGERLRATLSAVSVWNAYAATVTAKLRLALRT